MVFPSPSKEALVERFDFCRLKRRARRKVVSKILYLRQNYHFGPRKISDYLHRFHKVSIAGSSVHRILCRRGMNKLPANQKHQQHAKRWKRYEKAQPGHRLQMDVKFLERIRVLKIYDSCTQAAAIRFADEVIRRLPFRVLVIQPDNGAEFQSKFHWHLDELDIRHVYIRPRTPRLNGKVERSHRVDDQEFYQLLDKDGVSDDIHLFNNELREWENYYNYHRPHSALDGETPYERLLAKTGARTSPHS